MNYYYDPILGLQYDYISYYLILNIDALPNQFDISYWIKFIKETRIMPIDPSYKQGVEIIPQITSYKL